MTQISKTMDARARTAGALPLLPNKPKPTIFPRHFDPVAYAAALEVLG